MSSYPVAPTTSASTQRLDEPLLRELLALVQARRALPLAEYRRPMIERRVGYRMLRAGNPDLGAYLARLADDDRELDALVDAICIKVSRFFRGPEVFARLGDLLARAVAAGRRPQVWSAGCGRGEEAYTVAALLEAAGAPPECRVLATDADPASLAAVRTAVYAGRRLAEIPVDHRAAFSVGPDGFLRPRDSLRRRVETRPLELGSGPPPAGAFDLVLCRNVLIYFAPPLQRRAEDLLVRALAPGGVLCLGEAEWLPNAAERGLEPLDRRLHLLVRGSA